MNKIVAFLQKNNGYGTMKDMKSSGIHTREIARAVKEKLIEKIKPGLYKLSNSPRDEYSSFLDIARAKNNAVICLTSALAYHDLSTVNPDVITIAVPMNTVSFKIQYPPIQVYYFPKRLYSVGIEEIHTATGSFKIYSAEKTICDVFRYRNKLGEDIALEGLRNYLKKKGANINHLLQLAIVCRVKTVIFPYIKALIA